MPACALCENVQASGEACEVCGHLFAPGPPTPIVSESLEDLERTGIDPVQVVVSAMEDLQPTEVEGVPDDGLPDPLAAVTCRYCRNPTRPGEAFCEHCGMRLPTPPEGVEAPPASVLLCRDCGTPVKGASCPGCGARVRG